MVQLFYIKLVSVDLAQYEIFAIAGKDGINTLKEIISQTD